MADEERLNLSRRRLLKHGARASALALGGTTLLSPFRGQPIEAQGQQSPTAISIGALPPGVNAFSFIGRIDQVGPMWTIYGYLAYIDGANTSLLFTDPSAPGEATANFTFYGRAQLVSRAVLENLFAIDSAGFVNVYYNLTPNGNFSVPSTFYSGQMVATGPLVFHSSVNVQAPNTGIFAGEGSIAQLQQTPFSIGGQSYTFGTSGATLRLETTGEGKRSDPTTPISTVVATGVASVVSAGAGA